MLNGVFDLVYRRMNTSRGFLLPFSHEYQFCEVVPPGVVKLNFDGSCINLSTAEEFILRDWTSKVLQVGLANYG